MYDVIIVGAGPAGSLLAKKLAEANLKVLLVDRKKLPRHKMCSGLISSFARRILKKEVGDVPSVLCCHPKKNKGLQIYPTRRAPPQKFPEKAYNVWRSDFDFWLTTKASEAGAEVFDQTELLSFSEKKDTIEVSLKSIIGPQKQQTRFLIGADGWPSLIRRTLYKNEQINWFQLYQTYWKGEIDLSPEYLHAFLDPEFSEFFAWANIKTGTKGEYILIGTGAAKGSTIPRYYNLFQEYLEEAHGLRAEKLLFKEACTYPKFFDPSHTYKFGKNNILLIGEATGLMYMEGIAPALTSAVNASDAILQGGDQVLEQYEKNVQPLCRNLKIGWETVLKVFPGFYHKSK
ncbi:MAG: NAD(P)/FAD-dependent oxidoreductase [Candidatus Hodarchaeota archaeon]